MTPSSQLLNLGEQSGPTQGERFTPLPADLEQVRAIDLESTGGEAESTVELSHQLL